MPTPNLVENQELLAKPALSVQNISFAFGEHQLFNNFSCNIQEGAITSIIGANGSGKSTLLRLLTKDLQPTSGEIYLRRARISELKRKDYAKFVSVVHQQHITPHGLSVKELVGFGRYPHHSMTRTATNKDDERAIAWALEVTGLQDIADKETSSLSGGQLQRVWIAMALAQDTSIILLDEPTTYLDIRYQREVLELIQRLNKEHNKTLVMVLHDINQAIHYSDEIIAMAKGSICAQGNAKTLVTPELLLELYDIQLEMSSINNRPFVLTV